MTAELLLWWAVGMAVAFVWLAVILFAIKLSGMNRRTARTPPPRRKQDNP